MHFEYCLLKRGNGLERDRSTIHNWVHNVEYQPGDDRSPDHGAIDGTVIHLDDQYCWLSIAADPDSNDVPYVKPSSM